MGDCISVIIITFNEERNIARALKSVMEVADEIIVLDSFSTDHGNIEIKGKYKDGKKDGLWEFFNEDGTLQKTETYKNGVLVK